MGILDGVAGRVAGGATVEFRPSGGSMVPLIRSRQRVVVAPVDPARRRVQISNNRGRVNGWTGHDRVFGICLSVGGTDRPGVRERVRVVSR